MPERFKLQAMGIDVSIQRCTAEVPNDGKYYLIKSGEIIGSFREKNRAIKAFRALLKELEYEPPSQSEKDAQEILRSEMDDIEFYRSALYWGRSHEYRSGGKLRDR